MAGCEGEDLPLYLCCTLVALAGTPVGMPLAGTQARGAHAHLCDRTGWIPRAACMQGPRAVARR